MKPRTNRILSPTVAVAFVAPLLTFSSASAEVLSFNESNSTNEWTLPAGTNVLNGATATGTVNVHESSSNTWATLTDGILGIPGDNTATVTPNNNDTVTFPLDIVAQPAGYDITTFDAYVTWGDSGRSNQNFTLQYSTVGDPLTFNDIYTVANGDSGATNSTHTSLTDTNGVLASGVHSLRILFGSPVGQENGYVGFSEVVATTTPTNVSTLVEAAVGNGWTLPAGSNLLKGVDAIPATTETHEGSSPDWTTVTDGMLGTAGAIPTSVTPPNNSSVVFPLDLTVNEKGYNLTSIDTYAAWPNSGRDNQDIYISYATEADPFTFIKLANAVIHTAEPNNASHVRITPATGSFLATNVVSVQVNFGHQENGFVGFREFIALGSPAALADPLTWTGTSNANWVTSADNNWKQTVGGAPAAFNPLSFVTFDSTGTNRNITVGSNVTTAAVTIDNTAGSPYTFGGQLLTVSNDVVSSGSGSATFNNPVLASAGVALTGSGSLAFNGALQAGGLTLSGTGGITLNAANPALLGNASVSAGTLTVAHDNGLQNAAVVTTGGIVRFISAAPQIASLSGTFGSSVVLGSGSVNTNLSIGDTSSVTTFAGDITAAVGTISRLTKTGTSTLILSGMNDYPGATTVSGGTLELSQRLSLYNGNSSAWTAGNLIVGSGGTLTFKVGSFDELFTEPDLDTMALGGFQPGSTLGISNADEFTLARNLTQPGLGLFKSGAGILNLTGINTSDGLTKVINGTLNAASAGGTSIGGPVLLGDATGHVILNFGADNQLGSTSTLTLANANFYQTRVNLRGTSQTVAGLVSAPGNFLSLIQNDEIGQPGYTTNPGPATLTINTTTDHSFAGLIRNQDGDPVSVIKTGPATQEFLNAPVAGFGYTGPTTINEGTLKLNFNGGTSGFASDITINSPGILQLDGAFNIFRTISGTGKVVKTGSGMISMVNEAGLATANTYSGGTVIEEGILKFYANNGSTGGGNAHDQFCVAGPMDPLNVITVKSGATIGIGATAPLGQSSLLPQFAPTINIEPGGSLWGGDGTNIAFIANLNFDGATVDVTAGSDVGGFNTNMTFVGTVVVGGVSSDPTVVSTSGAGPNANISLGSIGLPGTTFQVADVTASADADLVISSNLRNVQANPSPLTKTGPGTMQLVGPKEYTGTTHVMEGVLQLDSATLADSANVAIDATGILDLQHSDTDLIGQLTLGGTAVDPGIYGSTTNATPGIIQTARITGPGMLEVTTGAAPTYDQWSAVITNVNDRDRSDDPDFDGFTNLDEFLFGTSPVTSTGSLTQFEDDGTNLIIRWNQRANSPSVYVLQESTTMENPWPTSTATITDNQFQDVPNYVSKQAVIPVTGSRKFVRVQGTE